MGTNNSNNKNDISENCNSGMERKYNEPFYIIKNPLIIFNIRHILNDKNIKIKKVIIPIRDYKISALSRQKNGYENGGLWMANNAYSQLGFYYKIMADYIYYMTKYNIDTIFLDFDRMVNDKKRNKFKFHIKTKKPLYLIIKNFLWDLGSIQNPSAHAFTALFVHKVIYFSHLTIQLYQIHLNNNPICITSCQNGFSLNAFGIHLN
jgi:hypothetical protein